jgi:hypothetical protein
LRSGDLVSSAPCRSALGNIALLGPFVDAAVAVVTAGVVAAVAAPVRLGVEWVTDMA